jgi:hypothetical protein
VHRVQQTGRGWHHSCVVAMAGRLARRGKEKARMRALGLMGTGGSGLPGSGTHGAGGGVRTAERWICQSGEAECG